ncbi:hypothetical protein NDU88_000743 [Pleurodeles waltl]|uniref:Uncharacterized protein n=1 Tax=Pleurodeles waltl TaxID=8319 RepID=A0AAV7TGR6_PLEWA|nr:hypothetical protein NDU88_000743 [Pleurodeles waltl]
MTQGWHQRGAPLMRPPSHSAASLCGRAIRPLSPSRSSQREDCLQSPLVSRRPGPGLVAAHPCLSSSGCTTSRGPTLLPSTGSVVLSEVERPLLSRLTREPGAGSALPSPVSLCLGSDTSGCR